MNFLGVFEPRRAVDGSELKSPRVISTTVIQRASRTSDTSDTILVLMSWGQFITHDMTNSSSFTSGQMNLNLYLPRKITPFDGTSHNIHNLL